MAKRPTYEELELRVKELEIELVDAKQAKGMLREAQDITQLLNFAPFGIFLIDLSGKIVACNERGAGHLGKTIETSIGTVLREYFPAEVAENKRLKDMEAIKLRQPVTFEDQVEGRWYRNSIFPVFDEQGNPVRLAIYGADVTEYKNALDALEKSEEKYRQLSDLLPQVVFETDEKGNLTFTNHMAFDLFGYTRADFGKGLNALQMLIPEDRERALKNIQKVFRGDKLGGTEYTALTKDSRTYPVMIYSNPVVSEGKPIGLRGIMVDLTEFKQVEEALRTSEEKSKAQYRSIPIPTYTWRKVGNDFVLEDYNAAAVTISQGKISDYRGKKAIEMNRHMPEIYDDISRCFNEKTFIEREMIYPLMTTGENKYFSVKYAFVPPDSVIVHTEDISNRKRYEEEIRSQKQLFEKVFTSQIDGIFLLDSKVPPLIMDCNPSATQMFGSSREEVLGRTTKFLHVDERTLKSFQRELHLSLEKEGYLHLDDFAMKRKDGSVFPTEHSVIPLNDEYGNRTGWVSVIRDISERKHAEEALLQSEEKYR
ncbi:MAG: PAS domain S-box protein, partial [Desulfobacteraceae bacterium]|nr:PAS domain S-box protein [Desulfobacteraceae bacterium]